MTEGPHTRETLAQVKFKKIPKGHVGGSVAGWNVTNGGNHLPSLQGP